METATVIIFLHENGKIKCTSVRNGDDYSPLDEHPINKEDMEAIQSALLKPLQRMAKHAESVGSEDGSRYYSRVTNPDTIDNIFTNHAPRCGELTPEQKKRFQKFLDGAGYGETIRLLFSGKTVDEIDTTMQAKLAEMYIDEAAEVAANLAVAKIEAKLASISQLAFQSQ